MTLTRYIDFRRHIRPFFLTPDGQRPTTNKIYYDILSYLTTQLAFCFTTAPFVLLSLNDSLLVWSRVYFYAVFGTVASMAVFASPVKPYLIQKLRERNEPALEKAAAMTAKSVAEGTRNTKKVESDAFGETHPIMGLPGDPGADVEEAVREIREEVEAIRRRGGVIEEPTVEDMKAAVEYKLGKKIS